MSVYNVEKMKICIVLSNNVAIINLNINIYIFMINDV